VSNTERRFTGTRNAGDDHQLAGRNFEIEVLEVVLARAANDDRAAEFLFHEGANYIEPAYNSGVIRV
jgi:hypothetical protein